MKAAVITEHGGPGSINIDNNFPDPTLGAEDVILKVGAASLNYHDISRVTACRELPFPCPPSWPWILPER